jgi:hypothetical protein
MCPEALVGSVFIALCHEVPEAPADELSKEPRGIGDRPEPRALGCGNERQLFALTAPNEALHLSLVKEDQQARDVGEVIRYDVPEGGWFCLSWC